MKASRFSDAQIVFILRQRQRGTAADGIILDRARRFLDPGHKPVVRRMIARAGDERDVRGRIGTDLKRACPAITTS